MTKPLGRHLDGCRIGFDLGGSDRKVAAVVNGEVVFSEETVWDPYHKPDPQYHFDGIMDSLRKAAEHLPRVDAIGGSAAGVYVNNRVKAGSLFRGVPQDLFDARVKDIFFEVRKAWQDVPFEVVNDGEVTALAGSMSLGKNAILGIALGTSTAAGYVTPDGNITSWLNELAFVPIAFNPDAPVDEWSGDFGVGSQYFSQQAVGRLAPLAGIETPADMGLPDKLKVVQKLRAEGHAGARQIYETLGTYLGYGVAHFADFYDIDTSSCSGVSPPGRWRRHRRGRASCARRGVPRTGATHHLSRARRKGQATWPGHCRGQPAGGRAMSGDNPYLRYVTTLADLAHRASSSSWVGFRCPRSRQLRLTRRRR